MSDTEATPAAPKLVTTSATALIRKYFFTGPNAPPAASVVAEFKKLTDADKLELGTAVAIEYGGKVENGTYLVPQGAV